MPPSPLPVSQGELQQLQYVLSDIATSLDAIFARSERMYARASRLIAAGALQADPFNLDDRGVAWLTRIISDMHNLRQVAYGQADAPGPYNYMAAISQETGFR